MRNSTFSTHSLLFLSLSSGVIGTTCIFPIDTIKTRLQASRGTYRGPLHCLTSILSKEGVPGFYRGLNANLIGVIPVHTSSYYSYYIEYELYMESVGEGDKIGRK